MATTAQPSTRGAALRTRRANHVRPGPGIDPLQRLDRRKAIQKHPTRVGELGRALPFPRTGRRACQAADHRARGNTRGLGDTNHTDVPDRLRTAARWSG